VSPGAASWSLDVIIITIIIIITTTTMKLTILSVMMVCRVLGDYDTMREEVGAKAAAEEVCGTKSIACTARLLYATPSR
jgi:hypothetical protein